MVKKPEDVVGLNENELELIGDLEREIDLNLTKNFERGKPFIYYVYRHGYTIRKVVLEELANHYKVVGWNVRWEEGNLNSGEMPGTHYVFHLASK